MACALLLARSKYTSRGPESSKKTADGRVVRMLSSKATVLVVSRFFVLGGLTGIITRKIEAVATSFAPDGRTEEAIMAFRCVVSVELVHGVFHPRTGTVTNDAEARNNRKKETETKDVLV